MSTQCEVRINITYHDHFLSRFPVSFRVVNSTETIQGFASLDLNSDRYALTSFGMPPESWAGEMDAVDQIIFGESTNSISVPVPVPRVHVFRASDPAEWDRVRAIVSATSDSPFFEHINDVVISPSSATTGQLILNPDHVSEHALFGEWYYTRNVARDNSSSSSPLSVSQEVLVSVSVGDDSTPTTPVAYRLDMIAESHVLPREAMEQFVDTLDRLAFNLMIIRHAHRDFSSHFLNLANNRRRRAYVSGSPDGYTLVMIHRIPGVDLQELLPTLHFSIHLDNGRMVRLELLPRDYLRVSTLDNNNYEVLFAADGSRPLTIGHSLISRIAIHIDPRNNRIGFADPVAEI